MEKLISYCNLNAPYPLKFLIDYKKPTNEYYESDNSFSRYLLPQLMRIIANYTSHNYLTRETEKDLHPIIIKALDMYDCDWFGIMLEWPHISLDNKRLAYTRSIDAGEADKQTVTSLGKYLTKHFPDLPANKIRDLAALFTPDVFEICDTTEAIINGVQKGPNTCMQGDEWGKDEDQEHPYNCYPPKFGWTLAVRIVDGSIDGRCLCNKKTFVRSFKRSLIKGEAYSHSDVVLEAWLKDQGYIHRNGWSSDCRIDTFDNELYPYLDGENQCCDDEGYIQNDGAYKCSNTDGTADSRESICDCEDCNEPIFENDDHLTVGRYENITVCSSCAENYVEAIGRNGYEYFVLDNETIQINNKIYEVEYLNENEIVELKNGDYAKEEDAVRIGDDWYLENDDDVEYSHEKDEYYLISEKKEESTC